MNIASRYLGLFVVPRRIFPVDSPFGLGEVAVSRTDVNDRTGDECRARVGLVYFYVLFVDLRTN